MAFHFKKKESPTKAVRRLGRERIGKALDQLRKCDRLEAIHSVRKEVKKVRAVLGLVREKTGRGAYRKNVKTLRAAGRFLRDARDAHVRPRTLERLMARFKDRLTPRSFAGIKKVLRRNCEAETRQFLRGKSVTTVDRMLRKLNRRAGGLKVKAEGWAAIRSGLRESYGQGQKSLAAALKEASPENLHQWRKHVQDLWHQLRLLYPMRPEDLRATAEETRALSQSLGDDHDLVMLWQFLNRLPAPGYAAEMPLLNELVESRRKELQTEAFRLGMRFYAEKPSIFCRRLENYWCVWKRNRR
jgi:CHAD domain-containing protein